MILLEKSFILTPPLKEEEAAADQPQNDFHDGVITNAALSRYKWVITEEKMAVKAREQ